ncbi:MaoC family dehydratase N-terminal domain-containing protein [Streptomyces mirabilis]|uniref:FAS1-like dehydratase domain-containing protein n=1 Tax=Streptomyces sp. NPDC005388 TaxID=3156717 RepID=UPI0033AE790E
MADTAPLTNETGPRPSPRLTRDTGPALSPGARLTAFTVTVERGRLRFFGSVIGLEDTEFTSLERAREAGHHDLPVPPTFLFGLELEHQADAQGPDGPPVDPSRVLHTEQSFSYHETAHAGDELVFSPVITDVYRRRAGTMEFVVRDTAVTRPDGTAVADLHQVIMVRHPEGER